MLLLYVVVPWFWFWSAVVEVMVICCCGYGMLLLFAVVLWQHTTAVVWLHKTWFLVLVCWCRRYGFGCILCCSSDKVHRAARRSFVATLGVNYLVLLGEYLSVFLWSSVLELCSVLLIWCKAYSYCPMVAYNSCIEDMVLVRYAVLYCCLLLV